jgi:hypothetical protein
VQPAVQVGQAAGRCALVERAREQGRQQRGPVQSLQDEVGPARLVHSGDGEPEIATYAITAASAATSPPAR